MKTELAWQKLFPLKSQKKFIYIKREHELPEGRREIKDESGSGS